MTLILSGSIAAHASVIVFSDDFSASTGSVFDTSGAIGSSTVWNLTSSGVDWGAKIDNGLMTLTNDASATANLNGWVFGSTSTSLFSSPYTTTLSSNATAVTWTFNMEQIRTDPAGFASTSYGVAFVLGGTSATARTVGNGYAIVLGQSGATDPIRLVTYTGGLGGTMTDVIPAVAPLNDVGANYLSLSVTYDPLTNGWSLAGRSDGASSFADPTSGTLSVLGTATSSTYTGTALDFMGGYWQGSTGAAQTALFDNITVSLADPIVASDFVFWDTNSVTEGSGNAGGNWSGTSWSSVADGTETTSTFTSGKTPIFAAGTDGIGTYTVTMDTPQTVSGLTFEEGNVTLGAGAGTLTLAGASVSVASGATATIEGPILGTVGLSKTGDGTLTLTGDNNYTGITTIGGGIVSISTDSNLGDASADIALGGGTLQSTAEISLAAGRDLSGTGSLAPAGGTMLTFNGAVSAGAVTVSDTGTVALAAAAGAKTVTGLAFTSPGTVAVTGVGLSLLGGITTTHTSGTATVSGNVDFGSGTRTISVADGSAATDLLLSGNLSGASVLAKVGLGTLSLTGDNSGLTGTGGTPASIRQGDAGTTPTAGGTIGFDNANALGTGQLQLNGGTLRNDSGAPLVITNANGISTGAQDHANTPGGLVFAGSAMEFTGGVALFKATGATYQHMITVNNTTTFSGVFGPSTGSGTSTGLTVAGAGKLVLSGAAANTFTEAVTVGDGVTAGTILEAAKAGALALNTGITVNDGGTLLLSGTGDRINDAASVTLAGGTFSLDSLLLGMESLGALILMADSEIDFGGTGSNNTLTFAGLDLNGFTLSIRNWSGPYYEYGQNDGGALTDQDRLLFSSDVSGENLAAVRFYDDTNTFLNSGQQISFIAGEQFEIVPIPEPTAILGAIGLLGLVGFRERRRVTGLISRFALQTRV